MQPVVFGVVEGDATGFSPHCGFRLLNAEVKQLLLVIYGADETVHVIKSIYLQPEEFRLTLRTRAGVHKVHVLRLRLSQTDGRVELPLV